MPNSSFKFVAAILMCGVTVMGQAQEVDARWRLRVEDLQHKVKIEATIRFSGGDATESCMGGAWKRAVVETKTAHDEKFFPLAEPLAYRLENGAITLGRTTVCDDYLFLSGKSDASTIHGAYEAIGIGSGQKLGYFTLKRIH